MCAMILKLRILSESYSISDIANCVGDNFLFGVRKDDLLVGTLRPLRAQLEQQQKEHEDFIKEYLSLSYNPNQ